jgi:hypothetical protein
MPSSICDRLPTFAWIALVLIAKPQDHGWLEQSLHQMSAHYPEAAREVVE